uniref:Small EDRK-rich factor-like N-terminal domain-containing protein n=1 Tax=Ailuropoda melanoleuca TaxID=9646 RepID=A0A7N5JM96_AILME
WDAGMNKLQESQQKHAKKQARPKKKEGHNQKPVAKAAFVSACTVCRTRTPGPETSPHPFESKHPKTRLPPGLADSSDGENQVNS